MITSPLEVMSVLRQYNPWWAGLPITDLPSWRRASFGELEQWLSDPPAPRAVLISGARQIGKTTLLLQMIQNLIEKGVAPQNILYVTFDHPLLKLAGLDGVVKLWREYEPAVEGQEYLLLDEIQYTRDWQTWLKHQVDFEKRRRIAVTGSATPLAEEGQESGVGRWHTIKLATLSFYEYLQIKQIDFPQLPEAQSLTEVFRWKTNDLARISEVARPLIAHFHEYLIRGGFPQCALVKSIDMAQKLLREDIVDKVLKRDMTALYGVRRILELEQTFLYLCLHDGGLLDMGSLASNLEVKKPTAQNYILLLESTHLIHKLWPYGYGKKILRARPKIYLADAAIAPSVMLKGKTMLEDEQAVSKAVETAFFKHVFTRYYQTSVGFSYWRGPKDLEVDIVADLKGQLVPFEVKYRSKNTGKGELKGLSLFCHEKKISRGYVITRDMNDLSILSIDKTQIAKIPAPLACYWLGQSELSTQSNLPAE